MEIVKFKIEGMLCNSCSLFIQRLFKGHEWIKVKKVNYRNALCEFEFDPDHVSKEEIINIINESSHYSVKGEMS